MIFSLVVLESPSAILTRSKNRTQDLKMRVNPDSSLD
jgi:hypothetical protein